MKDTCPQTPFYNQMAAIAARGPRFFVPGHKGNPAALPFGAVLQADLTEVEGACDLSCPQGALAQSEANMAAAYGSGATLYSASGSTSVICAMLSLFVGRGGKVVLARGCHVAAVRALAFLGAQPTWVPLQNGSLHPASAQAALAQSGAKVLYVTSPDYYGNMADIPALAKVCERQGAKLLVDNAHGAYLRFYRTSSHPNGLHPLTLGAHASADSAHKTLPCLTPAALFHLKDPALATAARKALNLYSSTSPAYPVLQSLDLAAGLLLGPAPPSFTGAAARFAQALSAFAAVVQPSSDPLRGVLWPAGCGIPAAQFHTALLAQGIAPEYFDGERLVLMASPWNTEEDFAALQAALAHLAGQLAPLPHAQPAPQPGPHSNLPLPQQACSIRQALFGQAETLPTSAAVGRVMTGLAAPCPPGVPLVLPGERILPAHAAAYAAGGILELDVLK